MSRRAIVIGAGLGGMASAIGLARAGYRVSLFEKATELTPAGFGIGITTNGMQALQHLGVYEAVARAGCIAADALVKSERGELLAVVKAQTIGERVGVPTRIFHRAALQQALRAQLPQDCLQLGMRCTALDERGGEIRARFADGSEAAADVLIGADGIHSTIRSLLHGEDEQRFAHYVIWLSVMELRHPVLTPRYNAHYWGTGSRFGIHDIGGGQWYWWGSKNKAEVPERLRALHLARCDENRADKAELVQQFASWPDEVRHAISSTPDERIFLVNSRDRRPLRSWSRGRVTLLGDAAHPMLTSLGQGAVMGFEDAAVLVRCLEAEPEVADALRIYERLRIPRTTRAVQASRRMSAIEQAGHPAAVGARNALFKRIPSGLLDRQLEAIGTFVMPAIPTRRTGGAIGAAPAPAMVVVTGASSGLGRAIAERLAHDGYQVFAGVRSEGARGELHALGCGERLLPVLLDVTDARAVGALAAELRRRADAGQRLHALINNAAICVGAPLETVAPAALQEQFEVNVIGVSRMVQAVLPLLLAARGRLINIGSNVGRMAPPFLGPYAASKAALEALTDVYRRELGPAGVQVSLIVPGPVMTPVWDKIDAGTAAALAGASDEVRRRYQGRLQKFLAMNRDSAERSRLRPEHVAELVARTLAARAPRPRYEIGFGATAGTVISRALPARWIDTAFHKALEPAAADGARP